MKGKLDEDVKATHLETIASSLGVEEVKDPDAFISALRGLLMLNSSEDDEEEDMGSGLKSVPDLSSFLSKK